MRDGREKMCARASKSVGVWLFSRNLLWYGIL